MRLEALPFTLALTIFALGCFNGNDHHLCEMREPIGKEAMKTTQILSTGDSKFCEITSDGEIWINGVKEGSIEANGEIWVAGAKEGSIESNGEVWKAGNKIGDVTSDLEIWFEGNNVGEIESDGTVWRNGDAIGSTQGGDPKRAAVVFFFGFFG